MSYLACSEKVCGHGRAKLYQGDCRDVVAQLDGAFDACFCDPPYELGFMGKHIKGQILTQSELPGGG